MTAGTAQPVLEDYRPQDREMVLRLWKRYFGEWSAARLTARWKWQFEQNPYASHRAPSMIVAKVGGDVVGHVSGIPLPVWANGRRHVALGASGLVVEEGQRWLGFRLLRELSRRGPILAAAMMPVVERILVQMGGHVPPLTRHRLAYPLRNDGALRDAVRRRVPRWLSPIVASPLVGRLSGWMPESTWPPPNPLPPVPEGGCVTPLADFDAGYQALWERTRARLRFTVDKDLEYMRWRYSTCPTVTALILGAYGSAGELEGIVVCMRRRQVVRGRPSAAVFGEVAELIAEDPRPGLIRRLLAHAIHIMDEWRVDQVTAGCFEEGLRPVFQELGFRAHVSDGFTMALVSPDAVGVAPKDLDQGALWAAGDGDTLYSLGW